MTDSDGFSAGDNRVEHFKRRPPTRERRVKVARNRREPQEPRNVLSSRHKQTDDLIESLQRSLMEQMALGASDRNTAALDGTLSGAVAPRIGPRQGSRSEKRTSGVNKGRSRSGQTAKILSKAQDLVSLGEALGIDMSMSVKAISQAKAALDRREQAVASQWAVRADDFARNELSLKCPSVMRRTSASLEELESISGIKVSLRNLMKRARTAYKNEEYEEALRTLKVARSRIEKAESEILLRIISESRSEFIRARRGGLKIDDAVSVLSKSRELLRRGEFAKAVGCVHESRKTIEKMFESQREARNPLVDCAKAIKLAETLGADVQGLNELLAEAKRLFKQNDLHRSAERSRKLLDLAKRTAYDRAAEAHASAEKALTLAKSISAVAPEAEGRLAKARELLEKNELALSVSASCASILDSDSAIASALVMRLKSIDEFARGIEQDVDSLTEVQDGIQNSRKRNLANLRKYTGQTEKIVGEAYECAAAYARVAQDIVKQAYENSVNVEPLKEIGVGATDRLELPSDIPSMEESPLDDKRQKLVDMFMTGKVSESQLDKLLLVLESSVDKDILV
jgi:ribosomal protein S20